MAAVRFLYFFGSGQPRSVIADKWLESERSGVPAMLTGQPASSSRFGDAAAEDRHPAYQIVPGTEDADAETLDWRPLSLGSPSIQAGAACQVTGACGVVCTGTSH